MGKVAAGKLNRRVTFQRKTSTADGWGQPVASWVDVVTVWANIRTVTGAGYAELQAGGTEVSHTTTSIRIRKRTDITHDMRAVVGSTIYDIRAVLPDEEGNEYLDVACIAGASEG